MTSGDTAPSIPMIVKASSPCAVSAEIQACGRLPEKDESYLSKGVGMAGLRAEIFLKYSGCGKSEGKRPPNESINASPFPPVGQLLSK